METALLPGSMMSSGLQRCQEPPRFLAKVTVDAGVIAQMGIREMTVGH